MDKVALALTFLSQLARLEQHTAEPGTRLTLRTPDGEFAGEVVLPESVVQALTTAASAIADARDELAAPAPGPAPEPDADLDELIAHYATHLTTDATHRRSSTPDPSAAAVFAATHPHLAADILALYNEVDPRTYLDDIVAADCPEAAQAAYEQMVTGEWDGEL
ncbi:MULTISPECIES: hypothetical protein [Streptomyces]|uniref:Uncharacterized protein n=1 Tax=Streptomyces fradiae ATCC 10745 = DSM 40063 TaxID=1319510 RepID=A0A1Y2NNM0_STRFR|nr:MULTISPECIES: hypothetical protein [Streptomyces]KAF0646308.1 hypothetical protein K701_29530 [Streptomyces fradiae ATCC 10745 = DSM 40063]OSY49092.1 hypothetical protein BG846_05331 [Streptomyces fradiae ATCC 10745 = DSM 40063]